MAAISCCFSKTRVIAARLIAAPVLSILLSGRLVADDWPQWRGPNRDAVWNETGILKAFPAGGLADRWTAPVGVGFSSPVVAEGRVYVTDSEIIRPKPRERIHAFGAATGKPLWDYSYDGNYPDWTFDTKNGAIGPT